MICMESLDLTSKLFDLKIKSKAPHQFYFMSRVFQEHSHCYDKIKKIRKPKNFTKIYLFLLPPLPSQDGGGGGGGCCNPAPFPPTFFMAKNFEFFFHRYMGYLDKEWVNWPNGNLSKNAKTAQEKIRKRGREELQQPPPPPLLLRES